MSVGAQLPGKLTQAQRVGKCTAALKRVMEMPAKWVHPGSRTLAAVQSSQPCFSRVSPCATYTAYTLYSHMIHIAI